MDAQRPKNNGERSGNPAHLHPKYSYVDHMNYAEEKLKSVDSFSEDQARRFKDGAVKIIREIYEEHTGLVFDISQPPPIALDLSFKNAKTSEPCDTPSTSFDKPDSSTRLRKSLREHSVENLMGSTSGHVMMAKKSYVPHTKPEGQLSRKLSRTSHSSTSTSSSQACKKARPVPVDRPKFYFPTLQEYLRKNPQWYDYHRIFIKAPRVSDTVNLDKDKE